jgi:hypothetical protein
VDAGAGEREERQGLSYDDRWTGGHCVWASQPHGRCTVSETSERAMWLVSALYEHSDKGSTSTSILVVLT